MKILSMKTTIFLGAMLSLLVCLMFTGCSNSETNSTSRGLTDFAHIEEEYLATIDSLNWPDGITLPDKLEDEDTGDRKSTRLNSSHIEESRMPSSA